MILSNAHQIHQCVGTAYLCIRLGWEISHPRFLLDPSQVCCNLVWTHAGLQSILGYHLPFLMSSFRGAGPLPWRRHTCGATCSVSGDSGSQPSRVLTYAHRLCLFVVSISQSMGVESEGDASPGEERSGERPPPQTNMIFQFFLLTRITTLDLLTFSKLSSRNPRRN